MDELKNAFYYFGESIKIGQNLTLDDPSKIYIGNNVKLRQNVCLSLSKRGNQNQDLRIKLEDRVYVGMGTIIESYNQVIIEDDCLIGPRVFISDSQHEYSNPNLPIANQGIKSIVNRLIVKRGAWIGANVTLIGDISIGNGSVIGANSVVTMSVPSHCVIYGNPASVLKIYHYKKREWVQPHSDEEILEILQQRGNFEGYNDDYILASLKKELEKIKNSSIL
ncbi:acyltransferase [Peribacillus asahii]|uniref:Acyltransferase n=1 Tax=Peribacillus asahii TaxID=228899 RepID=A0A398BA67_9BACI|nr:acyltransferase [Peribacillus asahii]RID84790.1 acyltransferase [Peribacillus asahii]